MRPPGIGNRDRPARAGSRSPWAALGLTAAALLAAGGALARSPDAATELVAVSEPCLNLRPGPGPEHAPVRCLPPGRRMTLLETRGEWGRVRLPDDQIGWVALGLLEPAGSATQGEAAAPRAAPAPPELEPQAPPEPEPRPAASEPGTPAAEESEAVVLARVRELEAALEAAEAERAELERALAEIIAEEDEVKARAAAAERLEEEVDELTALLGAAETFLAQFEAERRELEGQVAALREENQALRKRLETAADAREPDPADAASSGSPPEAAPAPPAAEPAAPATSAPPEEPTAEPEPAAEPVTSPPATDPVPAAPPPDEPVPSPRPSAAAPSPAQTPEDAPDTDGPMETVTAWARAWSEQRVEDYLSFYAASFEPRGGMSRAAWEAQRRQRISAPGRIEVKVTLRDVRTTSPDRVELEFLQSYSSDRYSDLVVKTLELVRESGSWKIARERSAPL